MSINIVIPMAGAGSRFAKEGYKLPKPFINVNGKMMIECVLDGLICPGATYTLIIQELFLQENKAELEKIQNSYNVNYITVEKLTQGASCTALAAHKIINNDKPVIFADSDNIFNSGLIEQLLIDANKRKLDGSLITFQTTQDCFSFIELGSEGFGIRTAEKIAISTNAIAGVYYFAKGSNFVEQAINMIIYNDRAKGEFYMSNVYNYLIKHGGKVGKFDIADDQWDCVGTPTQLQEYLER